MNKTLLPLKMIALTILIHSMTTFQSIAQNEKCGFDHILKQKQQDELFLRNRAQMERFIKQFAENSAESRSSGTVTIPCVVHVVHTGQAEGTIDNDQAGNNDGANPNDAQINSAITNMTDAFRHTGPYVGLNGYTASMDVNFVLAKTAPDGTATSGIKRYDVSGESWGTDYANNGMDAGLTPGVPQATITASRFWPPMDYMNIWIVHEVENATTTLGFASFPKANTGATDGLTMLATAFGYDTNCGMAGAISGSILDCGTNLNGTANHETGHYLNLYHTFTGDANGTTCPADVTCGTDSDCCPDIPAHKRTSGCPGDNPTGNDCPSPGSGPNSYIHNFMDYADDACFHGFSENQKTRMAAALADPRIALCNSIADDAPAATYPTTVTAPSVTNLDQTMGIYDVTLNGTTFKSWSSHHDGGYINRVASTPRVNLLFNTMYTMTVQVGVGNTSNDELVNVYIDYDNDGGFGQAGDEVYVTAGGAGKKNGETFSFNFTTPSSSAPPEGESSAPLPNQGLRMRIISDFDGGTALGSNHSPSQGGQIEDYTIELASPTPVELISFNAAPIEDAVLLNWKTATEVNNEGFEIQRRTGEEATSFQSIQWIRGMGTISEPQSYSFEDKNVQVGKVYYYRLKQMDTDGKFEYTEIIAAKLSGRAIQQLEAYPNPATNNVTVNLEGTWADDSLVQLFSATGQLLQSRVINAREIQSVTFDLSNMPAGIYLIKAMGAYEPQARKVIVNK